MLFLLALCIIYRRTINVVHFAIWKDVRRSSDIPYNNIIIAPWDSEDQYFRQKSLRLRKLHCQKQYKQPHTCISNYSSVTFYTLVIHSLQFPVPLQHIPCANRIEPQWHTTCTAGINSEHHCNGQTVSATCESDGHPTPLLTSASHVPKGSHHIALLKKYKIHTLKERRYYLNLCFLYKIIAGAYSVPHPSSSRSIQASLL